MLHIPESLCTRRQWLRLGGLGALGLSLPALLRAADAPGKQPAARSCVLFLLQFAHRRKPFILIWAAGWTLLAPAMLLIDRPYPSVILERAALGVSQCLIVSASGLVFWSADVFRQTRYVHAVRWPIAAGWHPIC